MISFRSVFRRLRSIMLVVLLACACVGPAWAQDEMPDEPPPPKPAAPQAPAQPPSTQPPVQPGTPVPAAPGNPGTEEEEPPAAPPPGTMLDQPIAELQGLDKITGRIRRLTVKVGESAPFGTLGIAVAACRKAPPEDPPESAAFLKITDTKRGEAPKTVFSGWMFASSPALSAMDHPVYDISVVDCTSDATASSTPAQ